MIREQDLRASRAWLAAITFTEIMILTAPHLCVLVCSWPHPHFLPTQYQSCPWSPRVRRQGIAGNQTRVFFHTTSTAVTRDFRAEHRLGDVVVGQHLGDAAGQVRPSTPGSGS